MESGSLDTMEEVRIDSLAAQTSPETVKTKVCETSPVSFDSDHFKSEKCYSKGSSCLKLWDGKDIVAQTAGEVGTPNCQEKARNTKNKLFIGQVKNMQQNTPNIFSFDLNMNAALSGKDSRQRNDSKCVMDDVFLPNIVLFGMSGKGVTVRKDLVSVISETETCKINIDQSAVCAEGEKRVVVKPDVDDGTDSRLMQTDEAPVESRDISEGCSPKPLDLTEAAYNDLNHLGRSAGHLNVNDTYDVNIFTGHGTPERPLTPKHQSISSTSSSNPASDLCEEARADSCDRTSYSSLSDSDSRWCVDDICELLKETNVTLATPECEEMGRSKRASKKKRQTAECLCSRQPGKNCATDASPPSSGVFSLSSSKRPTFLREQSRESSSSASSGESVMAVPLDPESPVSPDALGQFEFFSTVQGDFFTYPREGTDLVLMAQGVKFYVHRPVLLSACPMLRAQLHESGTNLAILHDKRAVDVLDFLRLLYPGQTHAVNDRNLEGVLDLALQFGAESVQRMCVTYLQGLAQFKHLCSHQASTKGVFPQTRSSASGRGTTACRRANANHQHTRNTSFDPDKSGSTFTCSSLSRTLRAVSSPHDKSPPDQQRERDSGNTSHMCACAETMAERVITFLLLASRHGLEEVYQLYVDVASRMMTDELKACPLYRHLPAAVRQDVVEARVSRLENIVSSVSIRRQDLTDCSKDRHQNFRFSFQGEVCLRCSSRHMMEDFKDVV